MLSLGLVAFFAAVVCVNVEQVADELDWVRTERCFSSIFFYQRLQKNHTLYYMVGSVLPLFYLVCLRDSEF